MDVWIWIGLVAVAALAVAVVWWKRRARRVYLIDRVRVEMHPPCVVEDRVIEQVWRAAISMTNTSRKPRALPSFAERATVRAERRVYLANLYLDTADLEVNPGGVALAWVEFRLPGRALSTLIEVNQLSIAAHRPRLQWRWSRELGRARPYACSQLWITRGDVGSMP